MKVSLFLTMGRIIAMVTLLLCSTSSNAGGYHTYLDEGNLLVKQLIVILVEEQVCTSTIDCQSQGGYAFIKPVKKGVEISVYGIKSDKVVARLLQACTAAFATKPLGQEMTAAIYDIRISDRINQSSLAKAPPIFKLKLEKINANR